MTMDYNIFLSQIVCRTEKICSTVLSYKLHKSDTLPSEILCVEWGRGGGEFKRGPRSPALNMK